MSPPKVLHVHACSRWTRPPKTPLLGVLKLRYQNVAAWNVRKSFIFRVLTLCQNVNQKNQSLLLAKGQDIMRETSNQSIHELLHDTLVCLVHLGKVPPGNEINSPSTCYILFHQGGQWCPGLWADLTKKPALGRHHFDSMDWCARTMGRPQIEDPTQFLAPSLPRTIRWNELKRIKKC